MDLADKEELETIDKIDWSEVKEYFKDEEIKPTPEIEDILIDHELLNLDEQD